MRRALFAATLSSALTLSVAASAQSLLFPNDAPAGKEANSFMIRGRAIGIIPLDLSSSISAIGGQVNASATPAPEADISYFLTDNIAFELIAATTRHEVTATGTSLGTVDVGHVRVLPPTLTAQYHFMPHSAFSPYLGAGINYTVFYNAQAAGGTVQHVSFDNNVGAAIQAGIDYNFAGHWFANLDAKQIFVNTTAHLTTGLGPVTAKTSLDPFVIGFGIGYRF